MNGPFPNDDMTRAQAQPAGRTNSTARRVVGIVGGGLVGLGTARAIQRAYPDVSVVVVEKERAPGLHQSTHNSGVLHAGLYYKPGSLKAQLAVSGIREMRAYCAEHGVAHETCGKLVVATSEAEIPRLQTLLERGVANGLQGVRWLSAAEAREIEPHVACVAAVHVPEEGIADYRGVVAALAAEVTGAGGGVRLQHDVRAIRRTARGWVLETSGGAIEVDLLVNCAGLQADRIAVLAGERPPCAIVPFRGEYFDLTPSARSLVNHLIYPTPDPRFPFLGVHFTRMIGGGVEAGPNAVPALAREGYDWGTIRLGDVWDMVRFPGLWAFAARHAAMTAFELRRSFSKATFTDSLRKLVPAIQSTDLTPGNAGVRAQAMRADGTLVEDFLLIERPGALHVLNAPSPAATASLAIGRHLAAVLGQQLAV